ncbi:flagellar basal-body MS-ring/collar protein FliF [Pigmentiphaga soli]|uniref:Flagellar M-ring protein n=2 Tax=Pigmentiphaga soli TaxID=1007095 RepID=A0ABP8HPQ3_9BURK
MLHDAFGRLSTRHRLALMIGIPLLAAVLVATLLWMRDPDYRVLFSGLADQDGGTIVAALEQQHVPYRLTEGGSAILVPADRVHEIRLRLASQGLPRSGNVGFELMDNSRMGLTQFQEQVNYQRALEGELARSIQSLGAVKAARVHLAIPKPSIFIREQNRPTASVLVQTYPGRTLDRGQVAGIVHLVSSSVPDLTPANVSVVDQTGGLLSSGDGPAGLDASQLEYLRSLEQQYVRRISDLLAPVVGAQNLRAQVAIDLDFSRQEQTDEIYKPNDPAGAAVRSRQTSEATEPGTGQGGVPGSLSNTPPGTATAPFTGNAATNPAVGAATAATAGQSVRRAGTTNYEVDKTVRYMSQPLGRIRRLSAAVVVNYRTATVNGAQVPVPVGADELAQIRSLVSEAVGFDDARRDSISVISVPFNDAVVETPPEPPFWQKPQFVAMARETGIALVIALAVLYLIIGVIRPAIRQLTAPPPPPPAPAPPPVFAQKPDEPPGSVPPEDALDRVRRFARENPQVVATVLRQWVNDAQTDAKPS